MVRSSFHLKLGIKVGPVVLPAAGLGVHGLVYGVLIGSLLYFLIQIPGLIKYQFKWTPRINLKDADVRKIMAMLGPRVDRYAALSADLYRPR